jgi:hypothetical protein
VSVGESGRKRLLLGALLDTFCAWEERRGRKNAGDGEQDSGPGRSANGVGLGGLGRDEDVGPTRQHAGDILGQSLGASRDRKDAKDGSWEWW